MPTPTFKKLSSTTNLFMLKATKVWHFCADPILNLGHLILSVFNPAVVAEWANSLVKFK